MRRGAANRRTLAAAVSKRCSTETLTIWRTIPTAVGSYHQPGQRASTCQENPSLRALGAMSQQQKQQQQQPQQQQAVTRSTSIALLLKRCL